MSSVIQEIIDDSPLIKLMATPKLRKILEKENLNGIYVTLVDGKLTATGYKINPTIEINTLKKALLKQSIK